MTVPRLAENVRGKGRMYRHPETGQMLPSVTNVIGCLEKPALVGWAAREVAAAAWDARHSLVKVPERSMGIDMLKGAPYKHRNRRADVGTLVHSIADALACDTRLPDFGPEEAAYADSFLAWVSDHDVVFSRSEVTVFNLTVGYAGTADFLAEIAGVAVIGDHKTGKGVYPEVSLQLAALRHAERMVCDDGLAPMPPVDMGVVVHLRPDGYSMHQVDTSAGAMAAFAALVGVWRWHKGGGSDGAVRAAS